MANLTNYQMDILAGEIYKKIKEDYLSKNDMPSPNIKATEVLARISEYNKIRETIQKAQLRLSELSKEIRSLSDDKNFYDYSEKGIDSLIAKKNEEALNRKIPSIDSIKGVLVTNTLEKKSIRIDDVVAQLTT